MKTVNFLNKSQGQVWLKVIGLLIWSIFMLLLGSLYNAQSSVEKDSSIVKTADTVLTDKTDIKIIRLDRERLSGENLGDYSPYEADRGDLIARGHDYFYSLDNNLGIGVWESKSGKMTYVDLKYDELMFVLDGSLVMTNQQGKVETFSSGEGLILPKGWSGTLAVPEGGVRKIWVSYMGGIKGK